MGSDAAFHWMELLGCCKTQLCETRIRDVPGLLAGLVNHCLMLCNELAALLHFVSFCDAARRTQGECRAGFVRDGEVCPTY